MRTTVSISDDLLKEAKKVSLKKNCTLGQVIDEALTLSLIARKNERNLPSPSDSPLTARAGHTQGWI